MQYNGSLVSKVTCILYNNKPWSQRSQIYLMNLSCGQSFATGGACMLGGDRLPDASAAEDVAARRGVQLPGLANLNIRFQADRTGDLHRSRCRIASAAVRNTKGDFRQLIITLVIRTDICVSWSIFSGSTSTVDSPCSYNPILSFHKLEKESIPPVVFLSSDSICIFHISWRNQHHRFRINRGLIGGQIR